MEMETKDKKLTKMLAKRKTDFVKVKCNGCGGEQITFSNPSLTVKCLVCDKVLVKPTGSKLEVVQGQVIQILK